MEVFSAVDRPAPEARVGTTVAGRYELEALLGEGGMGAVFRARDRASGDRVAIKLMHAHLEADPAVAERFRREALIGADLRHPNVARVHEVLIDPGGDTFLVMEHLLGRSLAAAMRDDGPFDVARALRIATAILDALDAVHRAGVVHRDLKPDNVFLVRPNEDVKVLDFGVAALLDLGAERRAQESLTPSGLIMGSPSYASPELIAGTGRDARSDLYAVGVLVFEMLTGHRPFEAATLFELCRRVLHDAPTPLRVFVREPDPAVVALVDRALEKVPARRFDSAATMRAQIAAISSAAAGGDPR